jgi:hypothetical protein
MMLATKGELKRKLGGGYRWLGGLLSAALLLGAISSAMADVTTDSTAGATGQNNGAETTHFTADYFDGPGGFFTAAGERIVKTAPNAFTKDSETILMSDISTWPAGTYTLDANGNFFIPGFSLTFSWLSDFDGQRAVSGTIVVTDNGDGTGTLDATLYY